MPAYRVTFGNPPSKWNVSSAPPSTSIILPAGSGEYADRGEAKPQSPFPRSPAPACPPPSTTSDAQLEEIAGLEVASQPTAGPGHRGGVGPLWAGPVLSTRLCCPGRPTPDKATSPPWPLDRTQHESSPDCWLCPQPCLDQTASNRCVRDRGSTHGLGTPPRVSIRVRVAPLRAATPVSLRPCGTGPPN